MGKLTLEKKVEMMAHLIGSLLNGASEHADPEFGWALVVAPFKGMNSLEGGEFLVAGNLNKRQERDLAKAWLEYCQRPQLGKEGEE